MTTIRVIGGLPIRDDMPAHYCPFCKKPVGYVGRVLAWFFGTKIHGCDFTNVMSAYEMSSRSDQTP